MALIVGGTTVTGTQTLDATKLSGNLPALNASSLTNVPSTAPTTSQVLTATAGLSAGAVGSYALIYKDMWTSRDAGDTTSGNLGWASTNSYVNGSAISGTWRVLGSMSGSNNAMQNTTLMLRIS